MTVSKDDLFSFDLWTMPWIGLEKEGGGIERLGIEQTLLRAHEFRGIFEVSPLVVVGIHRLLTAILQQIFSPGSEDDLKKIWLIPHIPYEKVVEFCEKYHDRFDIFSHDKPFYQSADVSPVLEKGANIKSVAYLAPDIPSGTESTHYRHGDQADHVFCPTCAAGGLVYQPAFATSGGAGIKPSINGVPPFYVIPCGKNLLESLLLSLVVPTYQPTARTTDLDLAWWRRDPVIPRSSEVVSVGYLHSLTFQPRRTRLYPEKMEDCACSRCGEPMSVGVRQMIFDMGESRPKDAPAWFDPFAAYKIRDTKPPIPIRPVEGKAAWREYASLFLKKRALDTREGKSKREEKTLRPAFLDQIANLQAGEPSSLSLRCVGLRTDMKAKVFEWVDTGFEVPGSLLRNEEAAYLIGRGLGYARDCAGTIAQVFRKSFGGSSKDADRYAQLKSAMMDDYWRQLAVPFRTYVTGIASAEDMLIPHEIWIKTVTSKAETAFTHAAEAIGDQGENLRKRFKGERLCRLYLFTASKKELSND
jgi:CRISPR system Cascade subunit CasA